MATSESKVIVKLEAEVGKLTTELDRANKKLGRFQKDTKKRTDNIQKSFRGLGNGLKAAIGAIGFAQLTRSIVQATAKQEAAVNQLEQGLASTGGIVGRSLDELTRKASELQNATTFGDEDIIQAQSQLVTFTNIVGNQFDKTIEAALDLSTRMDQDLKTSVVQLGKALNDPIKNLSALSRAGIQFSEDQKETIKALSESGRLAEAQSMILAELETQFGGSARAARDTFGGALKALNNAFGDLLEGKSGLVEAKSQIEEVTALLQDPQTVQAVDKLVSALGRLGGTAISAATGLVNLGDQLAINAAAITGNLSELDELNQQLKDVDRALNGNFLTKPIKFLFTPKEDLEKLRSDLQSQINKASEQLTGVPIKPPETGGISSPTLPPAIAPEVENKQFDSLIARLKEQVALYGKISNEAKVRYDIEKGAIGELGAAQEAALISAAQSLDEKIAAQAMVEAGLEKEIKLLKNLEKLSEQVEGLRVESLTAEAKAIEDLNEKQLKLVNALSEGIINEDEFTQISQGLIDRFTEVADKAKEKTTEINEFSLEMARNIQSSLADFLFDPFEDGLDGMLKSFAMTIQRMGAEAAAAKITEFLFSAAGGSTGGMIASIFGGARAEGGPVSSDKAYLVGERGPELFVPRGMGSVVPNHQMGMMGEQNINITFPGIRNANEAKIAAGAAGREAARSIRDGSRYA